MCVKWGDCQIVAWSFLFANNTSKHQFFSCVLHCPQISPLEFTLTPLLPGFDSDNFSPVAYLSFLNHPGCAFLPVVCLCHCFLASLVLQLANTDSIVCYRATLFLFSPLLFLSSDPIAACIPFRCVFAIFPPAPLGCVIWRDEKELSGRGDHGLPV